MYVNSQVPRQPLKRGVSKLLHIFVKQVSIASVCLIPHRSLDAEFLAIEKFTIFVILSELISLNLAILVSHNYNFYKNMLKLTAFE